MKTYTVYRIDFINDTKVPIGTVVERRQKERKNNARDLLRLAQKLYAESTIDQFHIMIGPD